ncbi:MAG TPA: hypothetical protein VGK54_02405, partial [Chloroflexota bacterium]
LAGRGVPDQWRTYPGGHDGEYWSTHVVDYLRFYDAAFNANLAADSFDGLDLVARPGLISDAAPLRNAPSESGQAGRFG